MYRLLVHGSRNALLIASVSRHQLRRGRVSCHINLVGRQCVSDVLLLCTPR